MLFSHILPSAIDGLIHIADCLLTHICHGFPIPSAVTQDLVDRIAAELEFTWYSLYSYPSIQEYSKAGIGFLIAEMWQVRHKDIPFFVWCHSVLSVAILRCFVKFATRKRPFRLVNFI